MSKRKQKSSKRKRKTKSKNDKKDILPRVIGEKISQRKASKGKKELGIPSSVVALPKIQDKPESVDKSYVLIEQQIRSKDLGHVVLPRLKKNKDGYIPKLQLKTSSRKMTTTNDIDNSRKDHKVTLDIPAKMSKPSKKIKNENTIKIKIRVNGKEALRKMPRACDSLSDASSKETVNQEPGMDYKEGGPSDVKPVLELSNAASNEQIEDAQEGFPSSGRLIREQHQLDLSRDEKILTESLASDDSQEVIFEEIQESGTDKFHAHRRHRRNKPKEKFHAKSKSKSSTEKETIDPGLSKVHPDRKRLLTTKEFIVEGLDRSNHDNRSHRKPKALAVTIRKPKISRRRECGDNYGIHGCKLLGNAIDLDEYVIAMVRLYNCHDEVTLDRVEEFPRELCQGS
ncbi:transcriptional regulator ATRX homolog isoform X1 [Actinia tenebrosa]|uniref:Transcriptional regulator ATRX homolog isoform X1 n=1 Tax=Actinia tenebrosa TaxID=6105 RepID=A0A6P8IGG0_ACTTE|nr:transcriptional regulator ATRX homolog isoform X1 [Actinia tenebrosa]